MMIIKKAQPTALSFHIYGLEELMYCGLLSVYFFNDIKTPTILQYYVQFMYGTDGES